MNSAVISLGSNIEPEQNMKKAIGFIMENFSLISKSELEWTKPRGFLDQPDFLNGVVLIETELSRRELHERLKDIEKKLGRVKTDNKAGPRTIDLDVIVWNGEIVHDDFNNYDFVKKAVSDIID
jgi:2-amino-4-hydroxy-6-hydroxymethyldihydropteridine diphosphokinase